MALPSELYCPISLAIATNPVRTNCGHIFQKEAIEEWKDKRRVCPVCRATIESIHPDRAIKSIVEEWLLKNGNIDKVQQTVLGWAQGVKAILQSFPNTINKQKCAIDKIVDELSSDKFKKMNVVFIGGTKSGKSTLLNCILSVCRKDSKEGEEKTFIEILPATTLAETNAIWSIQTHEKETCQIETATGSIEEFGSIDEVHTYIADNLKRSPGQKGMCKEMIVLKLPHEKFGLTAEYNFVDTPGLSEPSAVPLLQEFLRSHANGVVFVVDPNAGGLDVDEKFIDVALKTHASVVFVLSRLDLTIYNNRKKPGEAERIFEQVSHEITIKHHAPVRRVCCDPIINNEDCMVGKETVFTIEESRKQVADLFRELKSRMLTRIRPNALRSAIENVHCNAEEAFAEMAQSLEADFYSEYAGITHKMQQISDIENKYFYSWSSALQHAIEVDMKPSITSIVDNYVKASTADWWFSRNNYKEQLLKHCSEEIGKWLGKVIVKTLKDQWTKMWTEIKEVIAEAKPRLGQGRVTAPAQTLPSQQGVDLSTSVGYGALQALGAAALLAEEGAMVAAFGAAIGIGLVSAGVFAGVLVALGVGRKFHPFWTRAGNKAECVECLCQATKNHIPVVVMETQPEVASVLQDLGSQARNKLKNIMRLGKSEVLFHMHPELVPLSELCSKISTQKETLKKALVESLDAQEVI